ncbi:DegT/DnrJ/EryC1/StrS family aminotransferase [Eubacterium sp. MSJ-13]|uniref:DegT/DnrJ/EryC1/StrS family aminotransferase n=1 Tax=Eubacterium sp. MSJ-13 TaxID=2841513 RepID=UPI001C0FCB04|nr:DegT/DnrJ/EryC1/StrS family aminotransferase [Eubacterium sp. MSJ-13]MBU5477611.1 DegT/DnrJ/EryC1/StrS family aminotransferase [Eubacterium sp. MSJ-13]
MKKIGVGHASVSEIEKKYVLDALENERLSQGKYVSKFEKNFANEHDLKYGVMCNSGTTALQLALATLIETEKWDHNTEVLVPAITFIATSNACIHMGLKVKFVDVDPITYNMNPRELEKNISKNTKCIIPVHTFGMPCDMESIMEIAEKYNLRVIEDCAEAHFAKVNGKKIGSFGDMAAFSTYVAHTITTGIGGIVCTDNREYMEILRSLVAHGRACTCERCVASDGNQVCPKRLQTEIDRRFMFVRLGYSYRVGEIEGALGLAQLERKDEIMKKRHENAEYLIKNLEEFEDYIQLPKHPNNVEHTYMMFPIVVKERLNASRQEFVEHLEKRNIETRPMLPLLNQPIYKELFGNIEEQYPIAKMIDEKGFYIGCHHGMDKDDLDYVIENIKDFIKSHVFY